MTIRPILFSGQMVRALRAGRKSQTRRMLTVPDHLDASKGWADPGLGGGGYLKAPCKAFNDFEEGEIVERVRPKFEIGDVLWVRETWGIHNGPTIRCNPGAMPCARVADGFSPVTFRADADGKAWGLYGEPVWKPSIHMPRSASRLTLEVTGVKVERLQDISEADAMAEGVCQFCEDSDRPGSWEGLSLDDRAAMVRAMYCTAARAYQHLWETINGAGSWDATPWVVAVSFRVHQQNVDAYLKQREAVY